MARGGRREQGGRVRDASALFASRKVRQVREGTPQKNILWKRKRGWEAGGRGVGGKEPQTDADGTALTLVLEERIENCDK